MGVASAVAADASSANAKPRVRAVFVRPDVKQYWMGWPGASYDIAGRQADYTQDSDRGRRRSSASTWRSSGADLRHRAR